MQTQILRKIRQAVEQLNPNEVRQAAERPLVIRLAAESIPDYEMMEAFLSARPVSRKKRMEQASYIFRSDDEQMPKQSDLDIVMEGIEPPEGAFVFHPDRPTELVSEVLAAKQDLGLPLARCFSPFRKPVTDRIINNVSRENALFSLMTAAPNLFPGLQLPWAVPEAVSDATVLTINQIRMAFMLAAASDRPVGYREQKAEVGALIAGALGWRTLARELAGKIPFGGGLIPKAGIAFAGTYVAGLSLERLYRVGYGLTRAERRLAYGEAVERGREVATALLEGWRARKARKV
ncbi:MAG: hypothetical protein JJE04_15450 [Acidobacteriia bacterium]|nr:hypothetical protein [Terriglobia bacterium]